MNEKKNIITLAFFILWAILLTTLMIRLPVADLSVGLDVLPTDIVLSACFCSLGILSSVIGYLISSKTLILMSAINSFMQILSVICFFLYIFVFNRTILALALYMCNPFCAILSTPGFAILILFVILSAALPIIFTILLNKKIKNNNIQQ